MQPIALKCPSCGGNLQITPDMETFACGYCGTQQLVRREGGTISLKVIGEAIAGVKASTDRVAMELALRRLRDDLAEIEREGAQLDELIKKHKNKAKEKQPPELSAADSALLLLTLGVGIFLSVIARTQWEANWFVTAVVGLLPAIITFGVTEYRKLNRMVSRRAELTARHASVSKQIRKCRTELGV